MGWAWLLVWLYYSTTTVAGSRSERLLANAWTSYSSKHVLHVYAGSVGCLLFYEEMGSVSRVCLSRAFMSRQDRYYCQRQRLLVELLAAVVVVVVVTGVPIQYCGALFIAT